jgi:CrcB protein
MIAAVPPVLLVALGGGVGAALRYLAGGWAAAAFGPGLPWGTWLINLAGSFLLGWLLARLDGGGEALRLLLGVGVLGGFTTFSAFSVELVGMINRAEIGLAAAYAISSVAGGVVAAFLGVALGRI